MLCPMCFLPATDMQLSSSVPRLLAEYPAALRERDFHTAPHRNSSGARRAPGLVGEQRALAEEVGLEQVVDLARAARRVLVHHRLALQDDVEAVPGVALRAGSPAPLTAGGTSRACLCRMQARRLWPRRGSDAVCLPRHPLRMSAVWGGREGCEARAWLMTRAPGANACLSTASTSASFSARDSDASSGTLFRNSSTWLASPSCVSRMKCLRRRTAAGCERLPRLPAGTHPATLRTRCIHCPGV